MPRTRVPAAPRSVVQASMSPFRPGWSSCSLLLEKSGEFVHLVVPEPPVVLHQFECIPQRGSVEPAPIHSAIRNPVEQAGALEHVEMFRDGGAGHGKRLGQLADSGVTTGELRKNRASGRIGEGAKHVVESLCAAI